MAAHTAQSLCNTVQWLTFNQIPTSMCWLSMADIAEARNLFLTMWFDGCPDFSHILFVDADMEFPVAMIADMLAFDKPLVGCIYARRQWPASAVGRTFPGDTVANIVDGFLPVEGVGFGVTLIGRHVVSKMLEKMPSIVDKNIGNHPGAGTLRENKTDRLIRAFDPYVNDAGVRLSEDLAFCARWRACGGEVWANVNYLIGHIGPFNYAVRYADYLESKAQEASK